MKRASGGLAVGVAVTALLMAPGCSWLFVKAPPPAPPNRSRPLPPVECTSSVAAPAMDTGGVVLFGLVGAGTVVVGAGTSTCPAFFCQSSGWKTGEIVAGVAMLALATTLGFSAAYGYSTTAECQNLTQGQSSCLTGVEAACRSSNRGADPYGDK